MILDLIQRLKDEGNVSIIMILHNYVHVFTACDRVNLIQDGVIALDKPTAETSVAGAQRDRRRGVPAGPAGCAGRQRCRAARGPLGTGRGAGAAAGRAEHVGRDRDAGCRRRRRGTAGRGTHASAVVAAERRGLTSRVA